MTAAFRSKPTHPRRAAPLPSFCSQVVAKALALECMRAAKAQERGCYVFAFAGPQEVRGAGAGMRPARAMAGCLVPHITPWTVHRAAGG